MDDRRVGLAIRAVRRARGWRQTDLARASGLAQTSVSVIERGHLDRTSLAQIRRVFGALDGRFEFDVRWRGGGLDRTLDERHALLVGVAVDRLRRYGWDPQVEVTYAIYGERGSIDVLAFHRATGSLLVIEVKTELTSVEETLRRHDAKVRLGSRIGRERFGWAAATTSRILVIAELSTSRRRVVQHEAVLDAVLPDSSGAVRRWLSAPVGVLRGRWFLPVGTTGAGRATTGGPDRMRLRQRSPPRVDPPGSRCGAES